jgi:hypothetical protein
MSRSRNRLFARCDEIGSFVVCVCVTFYYNTMGVQHHSVVSMDLCIYLNKKIKNVYDFDGYMDDLVWGDIVQKLFT